MESSAFPSKMKIMKIPSLMTFCTILLVGGSVIYGSTDALGQTDQEKTPSADMWLKANSQIALFADARIKGRQLDVETTKGVKNDFEVATPPLGEALGDSEDSTAKDAKERAAKFRGLHANRLKLLIINSLFLSLMKP
jgi:hypothetical protein